MRCNRAERVGSSWNGGGGEYDGVCAVVGWGAVRSGRVCRCVVRWDGMGCGLVVCGGVWCGVVGARCSLVVYGGVW